LLFSLKTLTTSLFGQLKFDYIEFLFDFFILNLFSFFTENLYESLVDFIFIFQDL